MKRVAACVGLVLSAWVMGCAGNGDVRMRQQEWVIEDADPDAVLAEAAAILQREFGRAKVDASARRIETAPSEFTTVRASGTARDLYGAPLTMRRSAQFSVSRRGERTVARLRVDVERRDTVQRSTMQPEAHRLGDSPGQETAVDRDAATTAEQNTVWTHVRRDSKLERQLLEELRERCGRSAEPEPTGAPAPAAATPPQ